MSFVHIIPVILGETISRRTSGQTKRERTQQLIDEIMANPYPVDWSIGSNEGRSRSESITSNQVEPPRLARQRGGVITYDDGEMSIYARRSRS